MILTKLAPDLCDVKVNDHITIHLALTDYTEPGVWSVEIDGVEYREPRDLTDEPLKPGPFREQVEKLIALQRPRAVGQTVEGILGVEHREYPQT